MSRRNLWALSILLLILLSGGFLLTPLMSSVRSAAWSGWITLIARLTGNQPQPADQVRLETLLAENIRLEAELADYRRLRAHLGTPAYRDFKMIPAAIVGRPLDTFRSEFVISRGARAGVTLGAPVITSGSTLVGFISSLQEDSAVVRLLFHPTATLTVDILPHTEAERTELIGSGLVQGRHYTSLLLTTVPRDVILQEGAVVVSAAKAGQLPFGLFLGTIAELRGSKNEVYQEALLSVPYDADELRAVTVLVSP
jgi:cell shape-determining protein MreC